MAEFNIAIALTLTHEGGFENNPGDSGNWTGGHVGVGDQKGTNFGISAADFPTLNIPNLTVDQAKEIYRTKYWNILYDQIKDQLIANKIFDLGVLFGTGKSVSMLQSVLKITMDAHFGLQTLAAVNAAEPTSLLTAYKTIFVAHALQIGTLNPLDREFVGGWIRRINS